MRTRFGGTVTPIASTGEGWMKVKTEIGMREWHVSDMRFEEGDTEIAVVKKALEEAAEAAERAFP